MASGGTSLNVHDHGFSVDKKKNRVQCNYCGKQMSGVTRLKRHLGGIRKDVAACLQVPDDVKEAFRSMMLQESSAQTEDDSSSEEDSLLGVTRTSHDSQWKKTKKRIGQFFYEFDVDFSAVDSPRFRAMLGEPRCKIPSAEDLNGWILQEEVKEAEEYAKRVKDSWEITGCSVLLDAWVDEIGRDLVTFIADCPEGQLYLKSCDVSAIKSDVIALMLMIDEVVEEVGARNVIQIIACSVSGWVGELGKWYTEHHREIFWSACASHCLELMLEKIEKLDLVADVVNKVNKIWEFIHSDPAVLKLFRDHNRGKDLDLDVLYKNDDSGTRKSYLNLASVLSVEKNIKAMFGSSDLKNAISPSREEGVTVARLVEDASFWDAAKTVRNCMNPLVRGLSDMPKVGHLYNQMDRIKETVAMELYRNKLGYNQFWDVIDEVWDSHLDSPLHAAGYYLNPRAFYSTDFHLDPEVAAGLVSSLIQIVKEQSVRVKIMTQLDMYRLANDCFYSASRVEKISRIDPAEWWRRYADRHPELQSFAIKILSQTCEGASRYRLKRRVAEKLLAQGNNSPRKQKRLSDLAFVHYNLHLRPCEPKLEARDAKDDDDDDAAAAAAESDQVKIERFLFG